MGLARKAHGAEANLHIEENRQPSCLERARESDLCASTSLIEPPDSRACITGIVGYRQWASRFSAASGSYNRTHSYGDPNRLTAFNGQSHGYGDGGPYHAVDGIDSAGRDLRYRLSASGWSILRSSG